MQPDGRIWQHAHLASPRSRGLHTLRAGNAHGQRSTGTEEGGVLCAHRAQHVSQPFVLLHVLTRARVSVFRAQVSVPAEVVAAVIGAPAVRTRAPVPARAPALVTCRRLRRRQAQERCYCAYVSNKEAHSQRQAVCGRAPTRPRPSEGAAAVSGRAEMCGSGRHTGCRCGSVRCVINAVRVCGSKQQHAG